MKIFVDGDSVFVANDDFKDLQESQVVWGLCHEFCVAAAIAMVHINESTRHISYIGADDLNETTFQLKEGGKIPKVTIEWVDASEALPENQ